jgi:hypothetical protein
MKNKSKVVYLLYFDYNWKDMKPPPATIRGIFTTKKQVEYYCKKINKIDETKGHWYYVPFFINNTYYLDIHFNGNLPIPKYDPKVR